MAEHKEQKKAQAPPPPTNQPSVEIHWSDEDTSIPKAEGTSDDPILAKSVDEEVASLLSKQVRARLIKEKYGEDAYLEEMVAQRTQALEGALKWFGNAHSAALKALTVALATHHSETYSHDEQEIQTLMSEIDLSIERMRRDQSEIDRLKEETRAAIARLKAA